MADNNEQLQQAEQLQKLLLNSFINLFTMHGETAADRATLAKLLKENGWSLDPSRVPQTLKDKLTLPPADFPEEDNEAVVGSIARTG